MHTTDQIHERTQQRLKPALRVALVAALAVTAGACKNDATTIEHSPKPPARVGIDKAMGKIVTINTPSTIDLNTGKVVDNLGGSGFVVSAGEGKSAVLTALHVVTTACGKQEIIMTDSKGVLRNIGPQIETPRNPKIIPQPGTDRAVIVPKLSDINSIQGVPAATGGLKPGDSVYMLGFGTHYGEDGNSAGDPRNGDTATLVSGTVVDINNNPREAIIITGFKMLYDGRQDLHVEAGDSGGPALVETSDGSYAYAGVISRADGSETYTLSEITERMKLDDVKFKLPDSDAKDGKYGAAIIDLVVGPQEVGQLVSQAQPCTI